MRDYIILNGVNSNTITGLLISKLPPITKPKQRTTVEEIDGRDGDIVTKLGYSAYDKEIEIGLYGDFDIDDVIAYFNSEGTVTFSNEPDKFYNYQILDQIDYEKLIRFKKAKVRMHVQPFKYPLEETPVEITNQYVNNEAEEMDLDNTKEAPMTIALKGNTSQEETPTPDAPVDVSVVSGDNEIKVEGKNLFNDYYSGAETTLRGVTKKAGDNCVILNGTYDKQYNLDLWLTNSNGSTIGNMLLLKANTQYSVSIILEGTYSIDFTTAWISSRTLDNTFSWNYKTLEYSNGVFKGTFTTGNTDIYVGGIRFPISTAYNATFTDTKVRIQIEEGQPTEYQEYEGATYQITLPEGTELCKIGDYQDRIYKDSGKWYVKKEIGKYTFTGTEEWNSYSWNGITIFRTLFSSIKSSSQQYILSNYFTPVGPDDAIADGNIKNKYVNYYNLECVYSAKTLAEFKTWLSQNTVYLYYILATPTTTEITDETLIAQLNALANATSYDTKTHITQNANDKPFILNATALQQGSGEATVNNEGNIYSKPTLDIEGSGTIGIYLDGNQMFSVDLSNATECIIDTAQLEAYNPSTNALMNRQVTGDYSNFKLNAGESQVSTTGEITKVTISNYTRWL